MLSNSLIIFLMLAGLVIILMVKTAVIVPQRSEFVVERLGKFKKVLGAGFHILIPFFDKVAYKRTLKEEVLDISSQACITKDNVTVEVDGVVYLQVIDSKRSAYGIENYRQAASQLAQTSLRSAIGKIDLDKTFEERESINQQVVEAVDEAAQSWGAKVLRYEIKDITPPESVMNAMEQQMKAEREKRADIARSEGDKQARINRAEGLKREAIAISEGEKLKRINEAEGRSQEIILVAQATAMGLKEVGGTLEQEKGLKAANLRIAEKYLTEFGNIARKGTTMIIPSSLSDVAGMVSSVSSVLSQVGGKGVDQLPPGDSVDQRS